MSPKALRLLTATALLGLLTAPATFAADAPPARPPKPAPTPDAFYYKTGFDGREAALGAAVLETIRKLGPTDNVTADFTPEQVDMLGLAVAKAIKTISNDGQYQHEMNDALVKAHLTALQFAKDNNLLPQMIDHEVKTQMPMIQRVGNWVRGGASPELGILALTERTACFYQLVQNYKRDGMTIRWQAPYSRVLAVGTRIGQFNLTDKEIHESYTIPVMQKQAAIMGMEVDISPWQADGWVTMTMRQPAKVAAN